MPRFFIDTSDGQDSLRDGEGYILADRDAARIAALAALPDMARDKIPDGDKRTLAVVVREESGAVIYEAQLELTGRWV